MKDDEITAGDETWEPDEVDEQPALTNRSEVARQIQREYPPLLRDAGIGGNVTARVRVGLDGRVDPVAITIESTTHEAFGDAARRIVQRMRFRPARRGGKTVNAWTVAPIAFRLDR